MTGEDERPAALQEHIRRLRSADPELPLDKAEAIQQAASLRASDLSYPAIAKVMARYHGWYYTGSGWRWLVRQAGLPDLKPVQR